MRPKRLAQLWRADVVAEIAAAVVAAARQQPDLATTSWLLPLRLLHFAAVAAADARPPPPSRPLGGRVELDAWRPSARTCLQQPEVGQALDSGALPLLP